MVVKIKKYGWKSRKSRWIERKDEQSAEQSRVRKSRILSWLVSPICPREKFYGKDEHNKILIRRKWAIFFGYFFEICIRNLLFTKFENLVILAVVVRLNL